MCDENYLRGADLPGGNSPGEFDGGIHWGGGGSPVTILLSYVFGFLH